MRIGIFAGTFDPIHDGHIEVAKSAVKQLELDQLYFMVEKDPWTKKQPVEVGHRIAMTTLAIQDEPSLLQFDAQQDRFTLTETLQDIEQQFPNAELYFVFGADVFLHMNTDTWPGLASLLERHQIVVFERAQITEAEISQHARSLGIVTAIIPSKHQHHASKDVRMQPHHKNIWVPRAVAQYIDENNLY